MPGEPKRYTLRSGAVALLAGVLVTALAAMGDPRVLPWIWLGWFVGAAPGVVAGARLVRVHGTASTGFLKVLAGCMLARLLAFPAGALWAVGTGEPAVVAYAAGLVAGYLPTQVFEAAWFLKRSRPSGVNLTLAGADRS